MKITHSFVLSEKINGGAGRVYLSSYFLANFQVSMPEFKCLNCSFSGSSIDSVNKHQKTHKNAKYFCFECSKIIHSLGSFNVHLSKLHKKELKKSFNLLLCSNCTFSTFYLKTFLSHCRKHFSNRDPISCCNKTYYIASSLESHVHRNHSITNISLNSSLQSDQIPQPQISVPVRQDHTSQTANSVSPLNHQIFESPVRQIAPLQEPHFVLPHTSHTAELPDPNQSPQLTLFVPPESSHATKSPADPDQTSNTILSISSQNNHTLDSLAHSVQTSQPIHVVLAENSQTTQSHSRSDPTARNPHFISQANFCTSSPKSTSSPQKSNHSTRQTDTQEDRNDHYANFFNILKNRFCVTDEVIQFFVDEMMNLMNSLESEVKSVINTPDPVVDTKITEIFKNYSLDKFSSKFKRNKYIEDNFETVLPIQIPLKRNDLQEDRFFQYIPILDNLKLFLNDPQVNDLLFTPKQKKVGTLIDYNDGEIYEQNEFFNCEEKKVELILFLDAFNACNPLGTAKSKYKLHGLQYQVGNLAPKYRSNIDNNLLAAIINDKDVKNSGLSEILELIMPDFKKLETVGIEVKNFGNIKGSVVFVCGDNLGQHQLGGFLENFSSKTYICRYCHFDANKFDTNEVDIDELRTKTNYNENVGIAQDTSKHSKGIKNDCVLNQLEYFHVTSGLPPCIGHDWFQGVVSRDLYLVLSSLVGNQICTMNFIEASLKEITIMSKSKIVFPVISLKNENCSSNSTPTTSNTKTAKKAKETSKKISGTMSEMRNLIVCVPLLLLNREISNKVPNIALFLVTMVEISRILTTPEIGNEKISYLQSLIKDYFHYRQQCFPRAKLTPKHHYTVHYPDLFLKFGPLVRTWTLRFESKHKYFKYIVEHSKNFINLTKVLATRHQLLQATLKNIRFPKTSVIIKTSAVFTSLDKHQDFQLESLDLKFLNTRFKIGDSIVASSDDTKLSLVAIDNMFVNRELSDVLFSGMQTIMIYDENRCLYFEDEEIPATKVTVLASKMLSVKPEFLYKQRGIKYLSTFNDVRNFDLIYSN
jgi:hypothetical protein